MLPSVSNTFTVSSGEKSGSHTSYSYPCAIRNLPGTCPIGRTQPVTKTLPATVPDLHQDNILPACRRHFDFDRTIVIAGIRAERAVCAGNVHAHAESRLPQSILVPGQDTPRVVTGGETKRDERLGSTLPRGKILWCPPRIDRQPGRDSATRRTAFLACAGCWSWGLIRATPVNHFHLILGASDGDPASEIHLASSSGSVRPHYADAVFCSVTPPAYNAESGQFQSLVVKPPNPATGITADDFQPYI
jgi:hypothetical protein